MWQKLNVTAFPMRGIAGTQNIIGQPYADNDGVEYLPMAQQPVMIDCSTGEQLAEFCKRR